MEWVLSWVKSGLLFGVFASVILMLCPNKSYQKHVGLVVGLLFMLVMMHPLMEVFEVDGSTYVSYIRNFLMLEAGSERVTDSDLELYEESVNIQLMSNLIEGGYPVKKIETTAKADGGIEEVAILFEGEVERLTVLEGYLKGLFGEEVVISYVYR